MKPAIPEEITKGHTAIVGMTGSGKTSTTKLYVEQIIAQNPNARVCVLDTLKSDWWGITSSASGKSAGLPFKILGGPRGHVPLHSSAGKVIGQLVGTGKLPLSIVDMADFEAGGIQRFFVDFAQSLWKHIKGVVYVVIEEAHEVAPKERAGFGAENMAIHWAKKLATGSRTKGVRLVVATQRTQALHNAVLGSCQTVIAHQLMFDADQVPVINWVKSVNKSVAGEVASSIASLPVGTGWVCSGRAQIFQKVAFPKFRTYDNTATPDDDAGEIDVKTAAVDPDELRALIGEEVAKAEAEDPKKLRERIAVLERDNQKLERERDQARMAAPAVDPAAVEQARRAGFKAGFDEAINQSLRHIEGVKRGVAFALNDAAATINAAVAHPFEPNISVEDIPSGSPAAPRHAAAPAPRAAVSAAAARTPSPAASGDGSNSTAMTKALAAMVELASLGVRSPKREMIAAMADYSNIQSRPIREAFAQMVSFGWATASDGRLTLTEIGRSQVSVPPAPLTTDGMRDRIAAAIGSAAGKVLGELIAAYPASRTREEIAQACGYSNIQSRPIREAFSKLIDMGFVTSSAGSLRAGEALFP